MVVKLSFEKALKKTTKSEESRIRAPYQMCAVAVLIVADLSKDPLGAGLSFLEKIPNKYECLQNSASSMTNHMDDHKYSWKKCNRNEICA